MNFELDEEQVMLKTSARDFLEKECPRELVREIMEDDVKGYSPELWKKMAELGWFGLSFPEKYGGAEFTFLDLAVLLEECGRALVPGPVIPTIVQVGHTILAAGTEEQKQDILPKMINGELILTLAFMEESGSLEASGVTVKAEKKDDTYVINGTKLFVPDASVSDYILCVARTSVGATREDGITLFLVDAKTEGIQVEVLKTMTGEKLCEVVFDNVSVPAENIIGKPDKGWPLVQTILCETAVAEAAWMTGGARWVLDTTIDYAKERIAFERPIGSFQAIQHKLANMALEVECSTSIMYYAAWAISEDAPDKTMAASMAKAWCGDTYRNAAFDGVQIHGGIGFTWDHDMHLYFKRAKSSEVSFGDGDYHREIIAGLLDM
jgi:alkylation response protein AidB-like acyl-CoA dehydrogenase